MKFMFKIVRAVNFFLPFFMCWNALLADSPRVLVSIAPLHSLVSQITEGVGTVDLLLDSRQSPHLFNPTPHDMERLLQADVVFWIGPHLENGLVRLLQKRDKMNVAVIHAPRLKRLPLRTNEDFESHDHHSCGGHHHHHHNHSAEVQEHDEEASSILDAHVWLDPDNALIILDIIKETLIQLDPSNQKAYAANYENAVVKLKSLKDEMMVETRALQGKPFLVFHDGYQYFEKAFGLEGVGSFVLDVGAQPSLKRMRQLQEKIETKGVRCLFAEPQYKSETLTRLAQSLGIKVGVLDYLGIGITPGPNSYAEMMKGLSASLRACLHD
ncbi:MAG: zinc ABC transporter substrate-binding protein [Alphaproteobacteria bacterium]|nr:zinc ABC transporter substrate-binding protein [Alphaproteobacteria bacterium]